MVEVASSMVPMRHARCEELMGFNMGLACVCVCEGEGGR